MQKKSLFIKACEKKNDDRPPVWIMRQAGRYLPEYRRVREKHDFISMCQNPELAAEVTLQPIRRYAMDAAILFSDILVIPQALGSPLRFEENKGPVFDKPIRNPKDLEQWKENEAIENLSYVYKAIKYTKESLGDTPLIGFSGAPFTVAAYLVEGYVQKRFQVIKSMIFENPTFLKQIMDVLCETTIAHLNNQIKAGVDAIQIFESWANHLSCEDWKTFSYYYIEKIIKGLDNPENIPVIVFSKGSHFLLPHLKPTSADVLSLDETCPMLDMAKTIHKSVALQGNFDPALIYASPKIIEKKVNEHLVKMKNFKGYIVNLGHGLLPDMDPEHVKVFVETVKSF
ncbi:uroporphyrinogen decarboxylase [PVC group bacterium (ex Bugula neritina AB1)]|nr:uroporphyrinogen decarboxylase [PVC group bacterium (ex Bugula neritina AB1)]